MSKRITGLSEISSNYSAVLCDVWGVVHNGEKVYENAVRALAQFRAEGGSVVLLPNSPRPHIGVQQQLRDMGVSDETYDSIVTSGDVTQTLISQARVPIFHLGPVRDIPLFDGLDVELVDESTCGAVVCTGLFEDEVEGPEDYRDRLTELAARNIPFICANPDIIVERGERMIYCAGALAKLYEELGGTTRVAGKPHKPIYDLATKRLEIITGAQVEKSDFIAVGDGMPTDVAGALNNGFDLLYISAGIHSDHYGPADQPDERLLQDFLKDQGATPTAWMPRLTWNTTAGNTTAGTATI